MRSEVNVSQANTWADRASLSLVLCSDLNIQAQVQCDPFLCVQPVFTDL